MADCEEEFDMPQRDACICEAELSQPLNEAIGTTSTFLGTT